jgi:hypothetical protein
MKFNFNNLLQLIKDNKFIIILGAFILLLLILNSKPIIEGLTSSIGEYDYLAPIPSDNKISDDVFRQFMDKFNLNECPDGPSQFCVPTDVSTPDKFSAEKTKWESTFMTTEPEITYYIQNGKFPYNGYIMNWLKKQPSITQSNVDHDMQFYPNRYEYQWRIKPTESTMTPPPLAYNIYMGTAKPPPNFNYAATHPSTITPSTTTPSTTTPSTTVVPSNDANYNDFISLCKKTLAQ